MFLQAFFELLEIFLGQVLPIPLENPLSWIYTLLNLILQLSGGGQLPLGN